MSDHLVSTIEGLEALYGKPSGPAVAKEIDHINAGYRALIEAAPFVVIASNGPEGLDCSPKGDPSGFVRVLDEKTVAIPDRRGNNRLDSLRNIVGDPRVALLFLIPGVGETLRLNGRAAISVDPELAATFAIDGKAPRSMLIVTVDSIYFHCSKAVVRSDLWNPSHRVDRKSLPSAGAIIAEVTQGRLGGDAYDRELPERLKTQLY